MKGQHFTETVAEDDYTPLFEQVRKILQDRIVHRIYRPGDRLIERDIATELNVSRIPLREALRALKCQGFVSVLPRRGAIVRELTRTDVEELFDLRIALEVHAVRKATERIDEQGLAILKGTLERTERAVDAGDLAMIGVESEEFHDRIIYCAGNAMLASLLEPILGRLHWVLRQIEDPKRLLEAHRTLYEAIRAGDPERAGAVSHEHVRDSRAATLRMLFGDEGGPEPTTDASTVKAIETTRDRGAGTTVLRSAV